MKTLILYSVFFYSIFLHAEEEMRTWRALGGFKTEASFVDYNAGVVTLRKSDGTEINVRIERLTASDQRKVIEIAGQHARGAIPAGQIQKPTGRRELSWEEIVRGDPWPEQMQPQVKKALLGLKRGWSHAETEYFIIHYQQVGFAKQVARMADFQYQYIAADLPGFKDRVEEKSHIVVVRNREEWKDFLTNADSAPTWAGAYVRGMVMYLPDSGNSEANANILAHEMSHLILNRFFVHAPPVWLNEGLAEWYGNVGHSAFKGKKVDVEKGLGKLSNPYSLAELTSMKTYPAGDEAIHRYYNTSQQVVGMLMLRKDQPVFVEFLKAITVDGKSFMEPLRDVYGISDIQELQREFNEFLD